MEKRAKLGVNALLLIGIIYAGLGGLFVILGLFFAIGLKDTEAWMIGTIFAGIGGIFLVLGVIFLCLEWRKRRRANRLMAGGRYVWGQIVEFVPNYNVTVNGRHPYIAMVRYADGYGVTHIFKSGSLRIYPDPAAVGRQVKVYIENDTYEHYYVDMDGVMPRGVEH